MPWEFDKDIIWYDKWLSMVKFDGIRMQELVSIQDPDKDGGITLVFQDNRFLHIRIKDGKLETTSVPE
jgi:hypothetical protein